MTRPVSAEDWRACADVARAYGRSFFLASRLLPPARRRAILAAYAYCRVADDIVDRAELSGIAQARLDLQEWGSQLDRPTLPVPRAFAAARQEFGVPQEPVEHLLIGIASDLEPATLDHWHELERYCYLVAGTVGLMVAPIMGCRDESALTHAAELGIAMQITNILRDVAEDAAMGRVYLPREELARYGVSREAILAGRPESGFRDMMANQVERARQLYASAMKGVPALAPSGRATTLAAARLYAGILDEIEAMDFDVFQRRAVVPGHRKARIMSGVLGRWATISVHRAPAVSQPRPLYLDNPVRLIATGALDSGQPPGSAHD